MILLRDVSHNEYFRLVVVKRKAEHLYGRMLQKMYDLGTITRADIERDLGKYYNFPKCCINNYVELFKKVDMVAAHMDHLYGKPHKRVGYVLCFKCRIMRRR